MAFWGSRFSRGLGGNLGTSTFPVDIFNRLDFHVWHNDFVNVSDFGDGTEWVTTAIGAAIGQTVALDHDGVPGISPAFGAFSGHVLTVFAGTVDSTGVQAAFTGASGTGDYIIPFDNRAFAFGARFFFIPSATSAVFVGLSETDATLLTTAGAFGTADAIGFYSSVTSSTLTLEARRAAGAGSGSVSMGAHNEDWTEVAFVAQAKTITTDTDNGRIYVFSRDPVTGHWTQRGGITNAIPNDNLSPGFACVNGVGTDGNLILDYFWIAQER